MSQIQLATIAAVFIWLGLIAYAVLGGADFGGGIWDLLATGRYAKEQRQAIVDALGPVWEANNVWLIYVIVATWTAFPIVYAAVSTALFIPITLALIGIILRGAAFGFRSHYSARVGIASVWGRVFSIASTVTPFMLGAIAGAIASGQIRIVDGQVRANYWTTWTSPFALATGAFALGLCSVLAATYLTIEAQQAGNVILVSLFRTRAILAGAVTALIGAVAALLARVASPVLWAGLTGNALPLSLSAVLIGLAAAFCLLFTFYFAARLLVAAEAACILGAWGLAQYPYLIVPDVTVANAASPPSVLSLLIVATLAGMVLLLPSLWYLFTIFKNPRPPHPRVTAASFAQSLPSADPPEPAPGAPSDGTPAQPEHAQADAQADAHHEAPHLGPIPADRETLLLLPLAALLSLGVWGRLRDAYDHWRLRSRRTRQPRHRG